MKPFAVARPTTLAAAQALLSPTARPKAGGYDLLDLAKRGVSTPEVIVDLGRVGAPGSALDRIAADAKGEVTLGARVTLAAIAASKDVVAHCPLLADAAAEAATPQVRNVATLGGNLLQRPRCAYFRDPFFDCLKRGGRSCPAKEGVHDEGAVFANAICCAPHASNLAVALSAAGAFVRVASGFAPNGDAIWRVAQVLDEFLVRPEADPVREARIEPGELLLDAHVPSARASAYVEVNQKQSFDWAAASCAAVLTVADGKIASASIVLGAVAPVPWRVPAVEKALVGVKTDDADAIAKAAALAAEGATPLRDNAWKVRLVPVVVRRAVAKALERAGRSR